MVVGLGFMLCAAVAKWAHLPGLTAFADPVKYGGLDLVHSVRQAISPPVASTPIVVVQFGNEYLHESGDGRAHIPGKDIANVIAYASDRLAAAVVVDIELSDATDENKKVVEAIKNTQLRQPTAPTIILPVPLSRSTSGQCGYGSDVPIIGDHLAQPDLGMGTPRAPGGVIGASANLELDPDGKVRHVCVTQNAKLRKGETATPVQLPSLSFAAALAGSTDPVSSRSVLDAAALRTPSRLSAADLVRRGGDLHLSARNGKVAPIPISADTIIDTSDTSSVPDFPERAIWFIGISHDYSSDVHRVVTTPSSRSAQVPGVLIHAIATQDMLRHIRDGGFATAPVAANSSFVEWTIGIVALLCTTLFWWWRYRKEEHSLDSRGRPSLSALARSVCWYFGFVVVLFFIILATCVEIYSNRSAGPQDLEFAIPVAAVIFDGLTKTLMLVERFTEIVVDRLSGASTRVV